jgi:hypothetical protein
MSTPAACEEKAATVQEINQDIAGLQSDLKIAATGQKAFIAAQIKRLRVDLGVAQAALQACMQANGVPPPSPPIDGSFSGTMTLSNALTGTLVAPAGMAVTFTGDRTSVTVRALGTSPFGPISLTVPVLGLTVGSTTIRLRSIWPAAGPLVGRNLAITVRCELDWDVDYPFVVEDSTVNLLLSTTGAGGSAVDGAGAATFGLSGTASGGWADGTSISGNLTGTFSPSP